MKVEKWNADLKKSLLRIVVFTIAYSESPGMYEEKAHLKKKTH